MSSLDTAMNWYRQMAANIPDCSIYIFDEKYDYILAEGEQIAKENMSSEMLVGCNFFEIWPQEVTSSLASYYQDTLRGKRQKLQQKTEEGYFVQHFIPITDNDNNVLAGMVVLQNISLLTETQQKLHEVHRELRSKEQLLEAVVDSLSEGLIVCDRQGEVLLQNPAARVILDTVNENEHINDVGKRLIIKNNPQSGELTKQELPLSIALHGGAVNGFVTYVENRKKRDRGYIESDSRPIRNEQGKVEAGLLVMRDITHRKELEDLLDENLNTLKQKNERLQSMLNEVAKTLRGPAANINILLSLYDKVDNDEERELLFNKMKTASKMMEKSVSSFSTAIMAFTSLQEEWVYNDLYDVIADFRAEFRDEMRDENVSITTDFSAGNSLIFPADMLKGIIFNLFSTLIRFCTNEGSTLHLATVVENKATKLHVSCAKLKCSLEEEFIKLSSLPGDTADWQLIGLFIAKTNLESLGGNLRVLSGNEMELYF